MLLTHLLSRHSSPACPDPSDWNPPKDAYETQSAWVGDSVNFTW